MQAQQQGHNETEELVATAILRRMNTYKVVFLARLIIFCFINNGLWLLSFKANFRRKNGVDQTLRLT